MVDKFKEDDSIFSPYIVAGIFLHNPALIYFGFINSFDDSEEIYYVVATQSNIDQIRESIADYDLNDILD